MEIGVHVLRISQKTRQTVTDLAVLPLPAINLSSACLVPLSISGPNIVLNTIVAEELRQFADELEKGRFYERANALVKKDNQGT